MGAYGGGKGPVEALLRCADPGRLKRRPRSWIRPPGQLVKRDRHSPTYRLRNRQLVVAAPEILDEAMPGDDHPGAAVLLEATHRSQPRLQPTMVRLDSIVGVPVGAMPRRWQQLLQHYRMVAARSVTTLAGVTLVALMARSKNRRAALASRRAETNTSMTCPNWSIARYT